MLFLLIPLIFAKLMYDLTLKYNKNGWLYSIIGILIYYIATIIVGIIYSSFKGTNATQIYNEPIFLMLSVFVGMGSFMTYYFIMKKKWGSES